MSKSKRAIAYQNRVNEESIVAEDHGDCLSCEEPLLFHMRDNHHDFSIGLTAIIKCLKAAESEHAVPPLPVEWWISVRNRYKTP